MIFPSYERKYTYYSPLFTKELENKGFSISTEYEKGVKIVTASKGKQKYSYIEVPEFSGDLNVDVNAWNNIQKVKKNNET